MDIPILTGVQKGHISSQKSPHILLKNLVLNLYFQHEGYLYANCLFYILIIYLKCPLLYDMINLFHLGLKKGSTYYYKI